MPLPLSSIAIARPAHRGHHGGAADRRPARRLHQRAGRAQLVHGSQRLAREAVVATITTDAPAPATPGPISAAVVLRAALPQTSAPAANERALLVEWLDRISGPRRYGRADRPPGVRHGSS